MPEAVWQGKLHCAVCGHNWHGTVNMRAEDVADLPAEPLDCLPCPKCNNMTGRPDGPNEVDNEPQS